MPAPYELLIFDWDGTLMDSAGQFVRSFQQAIQDTGLPERTPGQMRELVGLGVQDVLARLFPELDPVRVRERISGYRQRYGWPRAQPRLFDGIDDTLKYLCERGFVLAVATGKSRRGLERAMAQTGCDQRFRITRCADESVPKPAPDMLKDILLRTATEPARALMIGDTEYDMAMARAADIDAVAVRCGVHEEIRLRRVGAIDVIDTVADLPDWLARAGR